MLWERERRPSTFIPMWYLCEGIGRAIINHLPIQEIAFDTTNFPLLTGNKWGFFAART